MLAREIDPEVRARHREVRASMLGRYLAGDLDEDVFRVFRLNNGIYGQRQGGHNQMVRVKVPYGSITPEQLDMFAHIAETYSRGWGHITTRQNVQFHFVQLEQVPDGAAGPRLGRAHHPGGVRRHRPQRHGLPPGRRLPVRGARHQPVGRGRLPALPPPPPRPAPPPQVQDQLLGLRDRLRPGDVQRRRRDRHHPHARRRHREAGFRVFVAGGLGANPHPALALEEFTPARTCCATLEAVPARRSTTRQPRQQAPGPHEVARGHHGLEELQAPDHQGAQVPRRLSSTWPGGIPEPSSPGAGDAPAGLGQGVDPHRDRPGHAGDAASGTTRTRRWDDGQRRARRGQGHRVGHTPTPASATSRRRSSGHWPRSSGSSAPRCGSPTARTSSSAA